MSELVKRAVLYDDKIQIYYNYTDSKMENKGTDGDSANRSFCFYNEEKVFNIGLCPSQMPLCLLESLKTIRFSAFTDIICTLGLCFMIF